MYFRNCLQRMLINLSDCFIISFGKSFNSATQSYETNIIHYWDTQIENVEVYYLGWEFCGHTTNNNLLNEIKDGTFMLTMKNLKLIMMNCPNVNWKLFERFISKRESKEHSHLISIENCNLHVLNNFSKQEQTLLVRICIGWWILF